MGYWKSKVLPRIKKAFDTKTGPGKKAAAADVCKEFDESKEKMDKELEEKKQELQPKVLEIYEACTAEIKAVVKAPTVASVKKHSTLVNKLLEDLAQIDFPGSKRASGASAKFGPVLVSSSVFFVFEKVATFLPADPAPEEEAVVVVEEETHKEPPKEEEEKEEKAAAATDQEVKKEEVVEPVEVKKEVEQTPTPPPAAKEEAPAPTEEPAPAKPAEPEAAAKPAEAGKA